jgi:hypothetical protein
MRELNAYAQTQALCFGTCGYQATICGVLDVLKHAQVAAADTWLSFLVSAAVVASNWF